MNYFINNFMKKLRFFELRKNGILKFNFFKNGFSLIELMISLIVISLIAAAFVPVITKKLSSSSIFAGSTGGGFNKSCSEIDEDCDLCAGSICLSCKKTCSADETLNTTSCSCESKIPYYMAVDGLYVTRFNMGDSAKTKIPKEAGVTVVKTGETCGSENDYSSKCCWQGETSGTDCDATNGDYSGCKRTVCNWAAANAICANYKQDGKTWRLPTTSEMVNWANNSKGKGNDGLMLCDYYLSGFSSAYCKGSGSCSGASIGFCYTGYVWSGSISNSSYAYSYNLYRGSWDKANYYSTGAFSVRCVSDIVSNCETYDSDGETCTACASGYYLSGKECKKSTKVENCETYSKTENKCETCKDGYELKNGKCEKIPYYMTVDGLYATRYNMGDSTETAIPSAAGVTVVNIGQTCGSSDNYSAKCCWKGATSGGDCDSANGNYSGCNRTVCTWAAANAICANYKQGGMSWRLPSHPEMANWPTYSKSLGSNGLMLCDQRSSYSSTYCGDSGSCPGSITGPCYPYYVWSGGVYYYTNAFSRYLSQGSWNGPIDNSRTNAFSVRCVSEIIANCKTYSGKSCTACNDGYYLSNNQCKARTTVSNCATYETTKDECKTCNQGYKLSSNKCVSDFDCSGQYFVLIGSRCVTKYNMGDSYDTAIPASAGVTVVSTGQTCDSINSYSAKCCWQGSTSGTNCNAGNGSYSGCNRTVCNWAAANAICATYTTGGKTWRLASTTEMANWGTYSKGKGNNGLMLCDYSSGYSSAYCDYIASCPGSYTGTCDPGYVWSTFEGYDYYYYYLLRGSWLKNTGMPSRALSVRCVTATLM